MRCENLTSRLERVQLEKRRYIPLQSTNSKMKDGRTINVLNPAQISVNPINISARLPYDFGKLS
jgi:hypothetical protein